MRRLLDEIGVLPAGVKVAVSVAVLLLLGGGLSLAAVMSRPTATGPKASPARAASSPRAEPAPPAPGPTPTVNPVAALQCRLPISNGQPGGGGFLSFPSADFSPDPSSAVGIPNEGGGQGLSYSRAAGRWLPVNRPQVRPDGKAYAFFDYRVEEIGVVDLASGTVSYLGPTFSSAASSARRQSISWQVLDAESDGVYASLPYGPVGPPPGLWFFPYSGSERQVTATGYWQAVAGGAAWGTATASVPQGATTTILRYDLKTGVTTSWFSQPGLNSRVAGFDAGGNPVIQGDSPEQVEVWVVARPDAALRLLSLPVPPGQPGPGQPGPGRPPFYVESVVGDGNGIWAGTTQGLYFAGPAAPQLVKVSPVTGVLGGGCA